MKGSFIYHDYQLLSAPEPLRIEHVEPHDSIPNPYYRMKFGYELTIIISPTRLLELGEAIADALAADTTEASTQVEGITTAVEAADLGVHA